MTTIEGELTPDAARAVDLGAVIEPVRPSAAEARA
jgi:hypothetical protein